MSELAAGWYPHPGEDGSERYWDGTAWTDHSRPTPVTPPGLVAAAAPPDVIADPAASGRSRWRATLLVPAVVAVLVLAGIGAFLVVGRAPSANAAVSKALTSTLADRTATITLTGSANVGPITVSESGSGSFDFTQHTGTMSMQETVAGKQVNEQEILSNQIVYVGLGSEIGQILPGKSWISVDLSQLSSGAGSTSPLGSGDLGTSDPGAILNILSQGGSTVTALGPSTINGATVQGYAVALNPAALKQRLANAHLPAWMTKAASSIADPSASYKVYVGSTGLVNRLTVTTNAQASGQSVSVNTSMDFSNFGAPVSVTPPPADQVGTLAEFVQAAKALQSPSVN